MKLIIRFIRTKTNNYKRQNNMIVVTGAAGFIGSCVVGKLNSLGRRDIIIVDDFSKQEKRDNYINKQYAKQIDREDFIAWFKENANVADEVYHLGARSNTTEWDWNVFLKLNLNYTKDIWTICAKNNIPLIYASSAATYGAGEMGYDDDEKLIPQLKPLNPYGHSKQEFDLWALAQEKKPPFFAGLKFFNVYGPNEYHKGRMSSVILHSFGQINQESKVQLFCSHKEGYEDGMQLRDFVYVKDLLSVMVFLMQDRKHSGIYNLGTGKARPFKALAQATFSAMGKEPNIEYIPMPVDIRDKYQYYTQAKMDKLINAGYKEPFYSLEDGVKDYVQNYLMKHLYY
jgi:ADP-L-glycero-D-manno-heptose-6-epimerase